MSSEDSDRPIGRPIMRERSNRDIDPAKTSSLPSESNERQGRHPADELGRPLQVPREMRAPTEEELTAIRVAEERKAKQLYAEVTGAQGSLSAFEKWQQGVTKSVGLGVAAMLAVTALFIFANTLQILAVLALQPTAVRWVGYSGVAVLLGILGYFLIRMLGFFYRLRVNQQVSKAQLRELSRRADLRDVARSDQMAAKKSLEAYLREYPLEGTVSLALLDEDAIKRMRQAKQSLLDRDQFATFDQWLTQFHDRFQGELDKAAESAVTKWRSLVLIKTGISPWPQVDSAFVVYCSYGMVGDLCQIYNLRMTSPGIIRLMGLCLFNSFAAGQIEDVLSSEGVSNMIASAVKNLDLQRLLQTAGGFVPIPGASIAFAAMGKLAGGTAEIVLPRAADGLANALLMNRLGHSAIAMLQPVGGVQS